MEEFFVENLYVKSPIDAEDITKGEVYKVVYVHELSYVEIKNDKGFEIGVLTEKSKYNCAVLNWEHKWQFCDKDGNPYKIK